MPTLAAEAQVIEFQMPWVAALLPLPWLLRRLLPPAPGNAPGIYFPDTARLEGLNGGASAALPRRARAGLLWLIWALLLLAATGPRWLGEEVSLPASGRDLMLAVDISASMETADLELNGRPADRLQVVKSVAGEFLRRRDGDRVGLILFGSSACNRSRCSRSAVPSSSRTQRSSTSALKKRQRLRRVTRSKCRA